MVDTAATTQDLSTLLGTVKERVKNYNTERKALSKSLRDIVAEATSLLTSLGEPVAVINTPPGVSVSSTAMRKRGRPAKSAKKKGAAKRGRPKGSKLSAEVRKKMSDAAKARWAEKKKG